MIVGIAVSSSWNRLVRSAVLPLSVVTFRGNFPEESSATRNVTGAQTRRGN